LDKSNHLPNQKPGKTLNKYDLTVFNRLFQCFSRALKARGDFQGFLWIHWIRLMTPEQAEEEEVKKRWRSTLPKLKKKKVQQPFYWKDALACSDISLGCSGFDAD
jgi:hypothetical protein